jgi:hypothetical protein
MPSEWDLLVGVGREAGEVVTGPPRAAVVVGRANARLNDDPRAPPVRLAARAAPPRVGGPFRTDAVLGEERRACTPPVTRRALRTRVATTPPRALCGVAASRARLASQRHARVRSPTSPRVERVAGRPPRRNDEREGCRGAIDIAALECREFSCTRVRAGCEREQAAPSHRHARNPGLHVWARPSEVVEALDDL